jgi:hypothetical protein
VGEGTNPTDGGKNDCHGFPNYLNNPLHPTRNASYPHHTPSQTIHTNLNPLTPNDHYNGRTTPLTSRRCILNIYSTNIRIEYFKHAAKSPFFSLQNAVYFIMLPCLVPVLFTF